MVKTSVTKQLFGFWWTHPGMFMGSILAGILLGLGKDHLDQQSIIDEIEITTKKFILVTNNLRNLYMYASDEICESFIKKDTQKLHKAIQDLLEGHTKYNKGSLQKMFDDKIDNKLK